MFMTKSATPTTTTSATPSIDPVPAAARAVLELFAAELRGVGFPGVDAAMLGELADEVRARAEDVERAETALDAARTALEERTAALAAVADRGLAYARIYAADEPALAARLASLALGERPDANEPTTTRSSSRRRRRSPESPGLPLGDVALADP
jgi:hypothetical protein